MTQNTLQEECTNCHNIYWTNMKELQMTWISKCSACKTVAGNDWSKVCSGVYLQVGA